MALKVYISGHRGMVGSALVRKLSRDKNIRLIVAGREELDLTNQAAVHAFLKSEAPDQIYLAAAKVGGIHANNNRPAVFIYENLIIQTNVIDAALRAGVQKLLFLGSSCIYPKHANQPIGENALLGGYLEETNAAYAVAKIAGLKLCESYNRQYGTDYRSIMPANLYGPNDNYNADESHVIPALIQRFHFAKLSQDAVVDVWGTGTPRREFLYVDDLAAACVHIADMPLQTYRQYTGPDLNHLNAGYGLDFSIRALAEKIADVVGYRGRIEFDREKPDGVPRKLLDSSRLRSSGWTPVVGLEEGLKYAYADFIRQHKLETE
ncbi:GDP-L-fucose synthase [Agrobacterium pusense]|uniref:GDP-L-fucose synthase family protein n=1 Tax=Agrobacterium pusense TaxID=648995 RepID=UPI00285463D8|nr:GDP-L-fucose synthase [Agrobacterium pusense]MDR6189631.1 GDP-L-fucose synthase [Agrobacterium pusense]